MSKFTSGGVPYPDYDAADATNFNQQVEFTDDVFIYGQLYADLDATDINFADDQEFESITLLENFNVSWSDVERNMQSSQWVKSRGGFQNFSIS